MEYDDLNRVPRGAGDVRSGMSELLAMCAHRHPHPTWDTIGRLDFDADVAAPRDWLMTRLPIPPNVDVLWFAMWDVTEGFDLRGSSSWSRDPDDWEWWYSTDYDAGPATSSILEQMHALAREADDTDGKAPSLYKTVDYWLSLGYVSLAAPAILAGLAPQLPGEREELWAVSGHPDEVWGTILPTGSARARIAGSSSSALTAGGSSPWSLPRARSRSRGWNPHAGAR